MKFVRISLIRLFLLFCIATSTLCIPRLAAQETDGAAAPEANAAETPPPEDDPPASAPETIEEMEIRTSTLAELAEWCAALGLSEAGSKEDLANRLRDYFKLPRPDGQKNADPAGRTIIIESARSTEYFSLTVVEEDYARLKGGVILSLRDGDAIHRIGAEEILYNRTRNWISASGDVSYERTEGDKTETFRGDSITVNLDNWETILANGQSQRDIAASASSYRFEGTVISVDGEESTVLTGAKVTNAKTEEPYWSLDASKMWLLSGTDWAVANAVLKVGEIPVMWLPFFYLPSDEIVFHPVVGERTREGSFFQTTTYILGRPKAAKTSESSFTNMFGDSGNMDKERHGFFLRSTGKKAVDATDTTLSLLFDMYANLGAYLGANLTLPTKGVFKDINISAGIGFSRDIYSNNSPFDTNGDDHWTWDKDADGKFPVPFFSTRVPFRYRFLAKGSIAVPVGFNIEWQIPFYSDPFVNYDFFDNRSETFDIMKLITGENEEDTTTTTSTPTELGAYSWTFSSRFTPKLPDFISPYISSFAISNISSTLAFQRKDAVGSVSSVSPFRRFFYPDKWTIFSLSSAIGGTLLSIGNGGASASTRVLEEHDVLRGIGVPISPWGTVDDEDAADVLAPSYDLQPPVLEQVFSLPVSSTVGFTVTYQLSPTASSELQFAHSNWKTADDIDWSDVSSVFTSLRGDGNIGFALNHSGGLFSTAVHLAGTGAWQSYSFQNEDFLTETDRDNNDLRAFQQTQFSTSYDFSASLKPFYLSPSWQNTSFQYNLKGLIVKNEFDGTVDDPHWELSHGAWNKDRVDSHQFSTNFNVSIMDMAQNLTLSATMPPKDAVYSGSASFKLWLSETKISAKIFNPFTYDPLGLEDRRVEDSLLDGRKRTFDPISLTERISYTAPAGTFWGGANGTTYSFQQDASYDPELTEWKSLRSLLTMGAFTAQYEMLYTKAFNLVEGVGWVESTDKAKLIPNTLKFNYSRKFNPILLWDGRVSFSPDIGTSLSFDLRQYTLSSFTSRIGLTLTITDFLDLTFSTNSLNNMIYRYMQDIPFFQTGVEIPGEKNMFMDLFNSFRFDNEALRRASGFKLKGLSLSMTHHLGDWDAKLDISLSPSRVEGSSPPISRFYPTITFLVEWMPIKEIQKKITLDKDVISW